MFANLPSQYKVISVDKFAHNPSFPLNDNWENSVLELINFVEQNRRENEKVVAINKDDIVIGKKTSDDYLFRTATCER